MTGKGNLIYGLQKVIIAFLVSFGFTVCVCAKDIVVSSAISLSDAFKDIARDYKRSHPQDTILYNFASSGSLLQQIVQGAPVDVFVSADEDTMDQAQRRNLIVADSRQDFVCNHLVLVTSVHNSLDIRNLSDLEQPVIKRIAVGQVASVPAGNYARKALQTFGLWQSLQGKLVPAQNVRQVLDYVVRDEVDAGFVYESDARVFSDRVKVLFRVPLPEPVRYPVALIQGSEKNGEAREFIRFILSAQGQGILRKYGFSACHS